MLQGALGSQREVFRAALGAGAAEDRTDRSGALTLFDQNRLL